MALKSYKPNTPGQRGLVLVSRESLWSGKPEKTLTIGLTKSGGRNNKGRVTARRRGGGHKRLYRMIDFKRNHYEIPAKVERIEYDPNRSANIALLKYADGERRYILCPSKMQIGVEVISSDKADIKDGNSLKLKDIPLGTNIHCVEMKPGKGGQIARSAGTSARLVAKEGIYSTLRLQSGEMRKVLSDCRATLGTVSNEENNLKSIGKAGANRWRGKRPTVRGVVMNPVDHPHGGGEGKTSGGRHPSTPWGVPTKGYKTRKKNKKSDSMIIKRRTK